jgi:hypothetical protein
VVANGHDHAVDLTVGIVAEHNSTISTGGGFEVAIALVGRRTVGPSKQ